VVNAGSACSSASAKQNLPIRVVSRTVEVSKERVLERLDVFCP
jgi:hypothetical protein